uniref:Death inducer-obliterator 1 n=2 Tax=Pygocentrus nattereri TaxID=42514 RepID=A0A3B4D3G2_PYGNA
MSEMFHLTFSTLVFFLSSDLDSSMEENGESQRMLVEDSSPKEVTKRWGFRRSTIAKREFMEEIGNLDISSVSAPRRGARQARGRGRGRGRGKDAGEMPSTSPAPKRGRGGRRSAPADLAPVSSPTDGNTILELGGGDCADLNTTHQTLNNSAAKAQSSLALEAVSDVEAVSEAAASDQAEDSDDLTLRELQERARNRQKLEEASTLSVPDLNLNTKSVNKDVEEVDVQKTCLQMEKNAVQEDTTPQKASRTSKKDQKRGVRKDEEEEQNEDTHKSSHDSEENDPNALYCICRQKHNNRFMICCDRCQEWFHGDCVGISEVRGRLLEENGEDYICPTCSPCQSPVDFMKQPALSTAALSSSSESIFSASKEEKVEQEVAEEKAAVPKCIGPGCDNSALPESVYCGHQCIIRHAAVAMQSISEPKTEPQIQTIQTKPAPKPIPKVNQTFCSVLLVKTENGDVESKAETKQDAPQPPNLPAPSDGPEKDEKTEKVNEKAASSAPLLRKPGSNPLPSRAKKTMPGSPRLAGLKLLQTEPPQVNKGTLTVPEKPLQSQEATAVPQNPTASSGQASEIRVLPVTPAPVPPPRPLQAHPNMQMRQNIRRSLTDTLMKRVTESDDLEISESDVGKLAVNIEREMFNMYYTTDSKYKNKYRTLLLSLKDPKNKGLFYQVIKGQITPFKLTRLSQQELQYSSIVTCPVFMEAQSSFNFFPVKEEKASASQVKPAQPRKVSTAVSDIVSSMLKDTTSEHRAHLFDLKCRICTGQISADEDTDVKIFKKEELKDEDEEKTPWVIPMFDTKPPNPTPVETDPIMESPASPTADDSSVETASSDFSPLVIPEVSVVSITRRDPRTASYRPAPSPSVAATSAPPTPQCPPLMPTEKEAVEVTKAVDPLPLPPPPPMPKSILMKPSAPSVPRFYSSSSSTTRLTSSHNPTENETSQFLSKQDTVWKGFLNMQTVAKFVTKGYLISGLGSAELLKKDLPDTIHIGGRILPQTVWEYVDKVKTSVTKEMSVIRFHPATDEEEVAYVSLFSYFNSRRRFGVVSNICNSIKDLYLIPLCAKESIPSVLLPLEGPGLEEQHPNLLIGLAICQKLKRLGTQAQEIDEKRPRIQIPLDSQGMIPIIKPAVLEATTDMSDPYDPDIPISTTPPGSPPDTQSPDSAASFTSSLSGPSVLSNILSGVNAPTSVSASTTKTTSSDLPPSSGAGTSSSTTPLQTILNTLFGKRTQDTVDTCEPSPSEVKELSVSSPTFDPVVQQYQQTPKNTVIEKMELDDNDRPYDPEEEYDQGIGYPSITTSKYNLGNNTLPSVNTSAVHDDVAYDPEDETVFEEMQTYLAYNKPSTSQYGLASTVSLSEQQKMLEELNRQIEEQKRQLEEQEEALRLQRAAVGVSMAHFSVSDALMSPPPCFGREPEDAAEKTSVVPLINPCRDPRQCKNVKQDAVSGNLTTVHNERENSLREISVRKQALTQATFLVPSNSLVMQDLSKTEQELMLDVKKNLDMPSVTLPDTMNTVEESSTNVNAVDLHSPVTLQTYTHLGASELEEGMCSSSGNENHQHSHSHTKVSGKSRHSRTSKWDNSSSKTQSRQDRRSHHEDRSSRVSKDEADRYRRKDRHSPDRSSRQSRTHSNREERVSSRQRDRHHHRSTSRHRSRRDRHSIRSHLSRSGKSAQPKNDKSCQRDQSPSRQRTESVQQTQSINQTASGPPKSQGDASQIEASEDGEQN